MSVPGLPTSADDTAALDAVLAWAEHGVNGALATILATWGSAPRGAGSHMAIAADGAFVGSVSGGCVEGTLIREARDCLEAGGPRTVRYGVSDADAWDAGLACGGSIVVRLDRVGDRPGDLSPRLVAHVRSALRRRTPVALCFPPGQPARLHPRPPPTTQTVPPRCPVETTPVVRPYPPRVRLVVVGAGHISRALVAMALPLGHEVHVVDPRSAFARPDRFPGAEVHVEYPDELLDRLGVDAHTAVVALTHDPRIDDPALTAALDGRALYVGALGSKRSHAARVERLQASGLAAAQIDRVHGPVGLPLGGRAPAEIALAILAELTQVRHRTPQ